MVLPRVGAHGPATAFFCAAPGGLGEMALLGHSLGANERAILLSHSTRILMVMFIVPPAYRLLTDYVPPPISAAPGSRTSAFMTGRYWRHPPSSAAARPRCCAFRPGRWSGRCSSARPRISAADGPRPPTELLAAAQVFIGCGAGARFVGVRPREFGRTVAVSVMYYSFFLAMAFLVAALVAAAGGFDFKAVHLAYTPGGFAEMNLIALSLDIDVAFVATHHTGASSWWCSARRCSPAALALHPPEGIAPPRSRADSDRCEAKRCIEGACPEFAEGRTSVPGASAGHAALRPG